MHGFWREIPTKLSVPPLHSLFWTGTGCNNFTMPKTKIKGSKKRDGRSNGNLNGESAKETMLSEMRLSGLDRLLSLVVILYTSVGYSECLRSACGTSAGQSAVYLQSAKKYIVTVFHSAKAARLGGPRCFLNLPQMRTNE